MNDLMSGGCTGPGRTPWSTPSNPPKDRHSSGRPAESGERPFALLDLAGGTGDIAFRVVEAGGAEHARHRDRHQRRHARGRSRAGDERGSTRRSPLSEGNAEALPFADRSYDAVTIAFGIRNVRASRGAFGSPSRAAPGRGASSAWSSPRDVPGLDAPL